MAKKRKTNYRLERICAPIRKGSYAEAVEHKQKILDKGQLTGIQVAEVKIKRHGRPRGGPEYFNVIPLKKVKVIPPEPEDPTLIAGKGAVN